MKIIKTIYIVVLFTALLYAEDKWYRTQSLNIPRGGAAAIAVDDTIYVFGGKTLNDSVLNTVERFNPATRTWDTTHVPSFKYARYNAGVVLFEGKIYLIGGRNRDSVLTTVEVYDPAQNSWQTAHNLRRERENMAGAVFNDRIYSIGGHRNDYSLIDAVEWYNQSENEWLDAIFNLPHPRAACFSGVFQESFYMFGGYYFGLTRTTYKAVPGASGYEWIQNGDLPEARAYGGTALSRDWFYLIGGETSYGKTKTVIVYDPETGNFSPCAPIQNPRSGIAAATIRDTVIYIMGGFEGEYNEPVATVEFYYGELTDVNDEDDNLTLPYVDEITVKGYPNPFNGAIQFDVLLPANDKYNFDIYGIDGQLVDTVFRGYLNMGQQRFIWQARSDLASGIYFLIIRNQKYFQKFKMVYVK